ncbi:MAG TPA: hypothetical protein PK762_08910 [Candidatus Kapabacteria bacterium]|nr:hypothetical protein [Candidatus Kapabacteria bacterium]
MATNIQSLAGYSSQIFHICQIWNICLSLQCFSLMMTGSHRIIWEKHTLRTFIGLS